jgi:nitrogen fixation-related uncharacterized protein
LSIHREKILYMVPKSINIISVILLVIF